ncbi:DUF423 domain-containing protein [Neokomagataea anthophila]|uniref:DUF423 domain-containing protein n=1 Tax=Neokomagataea anthophila TaxID=2826925 RepID=A0ABS5E5F0_9PROT|nr:DUF423 domain-containing protein [Neokomagataea anthophila]MBR0559132.1 DUF423 domain-containing protein [Neokomagataea anthophila]
MKRYPVPPHAGFNPRPFLIIGSLFGACGVILGAISAHLPLKDYAVPTGPTALHNAADMLMWHALALCGLAIGHHLLTPRFGRLAGYSFTGGTLLFVVPVILFALKDLHVGSLSIARIAPYGGTLLILGWLITALAAATHKRRI